MSIVPNFKFRQFYKDLAYKAQYGLTETECEESVKETCDFFGIPLPLLIHDITNDKDDQGTKIWFKDTHTMSDDVLDFDLKQLKKLGVHDKMAFSLIVTHEMTHRIFINKWLPGPDLGQWEQELIADFFMGVRAGLQGLDIRPVFNGLANTGGSGTHPTGKLRGEYMSYGLHLGLTNYSKGHSATVEEYKNLFLDYRRNHFKELYDAELTIY